MVERVVAIIPARGGSKRIKNKNSLDFFGKPLIAHTIESCLHSKMFDSVIVSTDDQKIAEIAMSYGAEVPFLREEFADDKSTVSQATVYYVQELERKLHRTYDIVVQLMPNCPLRGPKEIKKALLHFKKLNSNFQISAFKFGFMNPWWACTLTNDSKPKKLFPKATTIRSQDLSPVYCPTGAIWIARKSLLIKEKTFYGKNHTFHIIDWKAAVDIDTYEDLELAKVVYKLLQL